MIQNTNEVYDVGHIIDGLFYDLYENYPVCAKTTYICEGFDAKDAQKVAYENENIKAFYRYRNGDNTSDRGYAILDLASGTIGVQVLAHTKEIADEIIDEIKVLAPVATKSDSDTIFFSFWSDTPRGPNAIVRKLTVPTWKEIKPNYSEGTTELLEKLMNKDWRPTTQGQLIFWYGDAGTGKTTALRALGKEWQSWCNMHYIADPEQFFGAGASYMLSLITSDEGSMPGMVYRPDDEKEDEGSKWKLLILEDCGEMLGADAKTRLGQGLSRFLNVVDGLIGQGLRIIVLVTTNEGLKAMHPAVARPGRCAARIEFSPLNTDAANAWLIAKDSDERVDSESTIAELYAKISEETMISKPGRAKEKLGF